MAGPGEEHRDHLLSRGLRLAAFSIRFPVTIGMILIAFLVLGGVAVFKIPLVLFPSIDAPEIVVVVPYPNATPEQVLETITRPLEEALSTLPYVERIASWSRADQSVIQLTFPWGKDIAWLRAEAREIVERARSQLPGDVDRILVQNFNTEDIPIIEARIASHRDLRGAYDLLETHIKKPLEAVPGVGEVLIGGLEPREVGIFLRLADLKRYRVNVGRLFRRLDAANLNVTLGQLDDAGYRYRVLSRGTVASLEELRDFPIDGNGLKLGDIATVVLREPTPTYGRHINGEFAVALEIRKASDANTVDVVRRVTEKLEEVGDDPALEGLELVIWHNAGREITKSLAGLLNAGVIGAGFAVVVLFLFLRRTGATLLIGAAIPFSIVSAVGFLYLLGYDLNVLSMMGLMLATGMLVDNAVVVIEAIYQKLEKGMAPFRAAAEGTAEVIRAVVAATLTSVIIFVPLVFGRETDLTIFLGYTGVAIIITLFCSLFVSLTLIPMGVARWLKPERANWEEAVERGLTRLVKRFLAGRKGRPLWSMEQYLVLVSWVLRHRYGAGLLVVPLIVGISFYVLLSLPDSSFSAEELEDLEIQYEFSENYHYEKIERHFVTPVENYLLEHRDAFRIRDVYSYFENNSAVTRVYFDEERLTLDDLEHLRERIAAGLPVIPGAEIRLGARQGGGGSNWLSVSIYGEEPARLRELAREVKRRLEATGEFSEVHTAVDRGEQEVQIVLDRDRTAEYGLSAEGVANVLAIVLRGRELRGLPGPHGEIPVWVRLRETDRENLEDLQSLVVGNGPDGEEILLAQVADFRLARISGQVEREDRRTYTSVSCNYSGERRQDGMDLVREILQEMPFPDGYSWSFGFWTKRAGRENQEFLFNILLALFMVYFVMASLFESLAHPFAIMLSLAFAFVGVAWFLLLTGTPFNIMAQIGTLILIGVVVNNGIVLIDHINHLRRQGMPRNEAVLAGCRERFRPILMTAATTVVGLVPLAVGHSSLFDLRYFPMARTLMGGLMASTILTLVVLPTYYTLVDDLARGWRRIWRASRPRVLPEGQAEGVG